MYRMVLVMIMMAALSGCAVNNDYQIYADTQKAIAHATAMTETARYAALAEIAKSADPGAKTAAVLSIGVSPKMLPLDPPKSLPFFLK